MDKKRHSVILITFAIITIAVILYGGIQFGEAVNREVLSSMTQTVQQAAYQEQQSIDDIIVEKSRNIEVISETFSILDEDVDLIFEYLELAKSQHMFDNMLLVDTSGIGIAADGTQVDVSDEPFFTTAIEGGMGATEPYISRYTGSEVVAISTPINKDNELVGVLIVSYTTEYLTELLVEQTNKMGSSAIINGNGEIIIATNPDSDNINLIEEMSLSNGITEQDLYNDFAAGKEGAFSYNYNGYGRVAVYIPIMINDWMLFFTVPESSINQTVDGILESMLYFILLLVLIFLCFLLYALLSRRKHIGQVEQAAYYDKLTGLPNMLKLKLEIANALKSNPNLHYVIAKFDFENFKVINEMFDFEVGNQVLRAVAETSSHAPEPSFLFARVGSDEFIMFAANGFLEDLNAIKIEYEARFKSLLPELEKHSLSFRYGRYFIKDGECDVDEIVNKVTIAHSFAKANKKLDICDYDDALKKQMVKIADITNKKDDALKNEEFKVFLQPKYRLNGHEMIGAEALVRWIEADGTMVYPNDFIPLFEQTGFIIELDKYMFTKVCRTIRNWLDSVNRGVKISVNFSRINLTNPNFVAELADIASSYNVPSKYIEIEFTETTITENETNIIKVIDELHHNGFSVSIDDFGAGYSSLGMLKNFTVDTLKLDRSFFLNNDSDRGNLVIGGIIKLAQNLEMSVVAEGIEESEQADFLRDINCEYAQGYYFAKPMSLADFAEIYIKNTDDIIAGNDKN